MGELPEPPTKIARLIESAEVTFESGARSPRSGSRSGRGIIAETEYRIAYNYVAKSRWRKVSGNSLVIDVSYSKITWQPKHSIWFRDRPARSGFWSNRLVLHELDHVLISNDPRMKARFEEILRREKTLTREIVPAQVVNRQFVDRVVDQHVGNVFSEITELISIRYRELDRVTRHGMQPLPRNSSLNELLRPESAGSP